MIATQTETTAITNLSGGNVATPREFSQSLVTKRTLHECRHLKHMLRKAGGGRRIDPAGQKLAAEYARLLRQLEENISNDKILSLRGESRRARWNSHGQIGRQESKLETQTREAITKKRDAVSCVHLILQHSTHVHLLRMLNDNAKSGGKKLIVSTFSSIAAMSAKNIP